MRQWLLLICLIFYSLTVWSDQLIIEPNMGRTPLINKINQAQHSVDLVMYGFTDQALLDTLIQQKQHGKEVNVILEDKPYKFTEENEKAIQAFNRNHINWQWEIPPYRLIHQKTLIIDDHRAIVMTFNFTNASFKNERNFALIIEDPQLVKAIDGVFKADWQHKPSHNTVPDLIYSPDDSRNKLIHLISEAKQIINIYAQNVNDYKIVGALAKAARSGVEVNILTSSSNKDKQADYLARNNVNVHKSKHLYIHAKTMVIDDKLAVIGSINFTRSALDNNRELSVISHDPKVIKQLNEVFQQDWRDSNAWQIQSVFHVKPHDINRAIKTLVKTLSQ